MFRTLFRKVMALICTISPKLTSKIYYETKLKKRLNLKEPKTFNEKLMWLKLNEYENNKLIIECADKYKVRHYIKRCGCEEILNELVGVYNKVDEINFTELPQKFVLKCNHAAGFNIICENKEKLDIEKTKKQLKKWLKEDYWKYVAELQYKNIERKIICEKFLNSKDGNAIEDYKIYCFNGKPLFCMICIGRNFGKPKYYFMDREWNLMRINEAGINAPKDFILPKPVCIDEMYKYAEKLAKPFKFVRADFYEYNGKTIFGELTFTPAGCVDDKYTQEAQLELGKMININ